MSIDLGTLKTYLDADDRGLMASLNKGIDKLKEYEKTAKDVSIAAGAAFAATSAVIYKSVKAFDTINKSIAKVEIALRSANDEFSTSRTRALDFAEAMQKATRYSDDAILNAVALGRNFGFLEEQTEALVMGAADLSTALGMDLRTSMRYLGRAVQSGQNVLDRYGFVLTEVEKTAMDAGTASERLETILGAIENRAGGLAQEVTQTAAGAFVVLGNEVSNVLETFGEFLDSPISSFINRITHIVQTFRGALEGLNGEKQAFIARLTLATLGVSGFVLALSGITLIMIKLLPAFATLAGIFVAIFSVKTILAIGAVALALGKIALAVGVVIGVLGGLKLIFDEIGSSLVDSLSKAFRWLKGQISSLADTLDGLFSRFQQWNLEKVMERHSTSPERLSKALTTEAYITAPFDPDRAGILHDAAYSLSQGVYGTSDAIKEVRNRLAGSSGLSSMVEQASKSLGFVGEEFRSKGEKAGAAIVSGMDTILDDLKNSGKNTWDAFLSLIPSDLRDLVSDTFGGAKGFVENLFGEIDFDRLKGFGEDLSGTIQGVIDKLKEGQNKISEYNNSLDGLLVQISEMTKSPSTEVGGLELQWDSLRDELKYLGERTGRDISNALFELSDHFSSQIRKARDGANFELDLLLSTLSGEISAEKANIKREWKSTLDQIKYLGETINLSASDMQEAINTANEHFANKIADLSNNSATEIGRTFERVTDNFRMIELEAIRMTGQLGQLVRTIQTAVQTGDPVAAGILIMMDVLGRSKQFAGALDAVTDTLQTVVDSVGMILEPALGALGYALEVIGEIFGQLAPLFGFIGEILMMNAPVIVLLGMALQAIMPLFLLIGEVLKVMAPLLELVFMTWFYQLKMTLLGILGIFIALMFVWNAIVWAIQGIIKLIAAAIGWAFRGAGEKLRELAESMEGWKADTDSAVKAFGDIWDMSWEDAQQTLKDATIDIDGLGDAAQSAADALLNIPRGFRVGRARWTAQDTTSSGGTSISEPDYPDYKGPDLGAPFDDRAVSEHPFLEIRKPEWADSLWEIPQPYWIDNLLEIPQPKWIDHLIDKPLLDLPAPSPSLPSPMIPPPIAPPPSMADRGIGGGIDTPPMIINVDRVETGSPRDFVAEMEKMAARKAYARTGTAAPTAPPFLRMGK